MRSEGALKRGDETSKSGGKWKMGSEVHWSEVKWSDGKWSEVKWSEVTGSEVKWSEVKWSEVKWSDGKWSEVKGSEVTGSEVKMFGEMFELSSIYINVTVPSFCTVRCVIIICFSLSFPNCWTYVF